MFKALLLSIWLNLIVSATILFTSGKYVELLGLDQGGKTASSNLRNAVLPPTSVALIRDGRVAGYFIVDVAFLLTNTNGYSDETINLILQNAVVNSLYGNPDVSDEVLDELDLQKLQSRIVLEVEKSVDSGLVESVLLQRVDYRTIDEIRDNKLRRLSKQ